MSQPINNIADLRNEIARLQIVKAEQEAAIKEHFSSPSAIIGTVMSGFGGDKGKGSFFKADDIVSLISRFVLPFALNKTIFRKSNFIIKAIVGMLSQSASGFINEKSVASVWGKLKSIIPQKWTAKKSGKPVDYGIPPLSETY
ncbi:hypothetical protein BEL04_22085 [Mucilaginibacter sp. PPCGB 2223]|uniref:hypothetical protein n=1 Tax=Mucilaginibacter sp. PPCGB 2223 TaxID=1886027 RepID=UPI00082552E6|nr:hypothetical protein [Mucilaginibacter sp. PPCGB 2223]OCX50474.1 hypothetical protein BEL04_22085 [Mucilaginibacter sp. PPCGB 2223]